MVDDGGLMMNEKSSEGGGATVYRSTDGQVVKVVHQDGSETAV